MVTCGLFSGLLNDVEKLFFPLPKTWVCESHAQGSLRPAVSCCFFPAEAEYSYFSADFHMTNVVSIKRMAGAVFVAFWPVLPFKEARLRQKRRILHGLVKNYIVFTNFQHTSNPQPRVYSKFHLRYSSCKYILAKKKEHMSQSYFFSTCTVLCLDCAVQKF